MNQENTNALHEAAPILYRHKSQFDCGDGWFSLLMELSRKIEALNQQADEKEQVVLMQAKEKFGGLRFYVDRYTDEVGKLISQAEDASWKVCEECGVDGTLRKEGWWSVLCDRCHVEKVKE